MSFATASDSQFLHLCYGLVLNDTVQSEVDLLYHMDVEDGIYDTVLKSLYTPGTPPSESLSPIVRYRHFPLLDVLKINKK